ncbi:MAG: hypothetical protein E7137_05510 [Rikenellaceae bacterium]|nr:hypothetical protein [Rikenellaceae bacterium]
MKRLLLFCSLFLLGVACNNEENDNLELNVIDPGTEIAGLITNLGGYDVSSVATLLSQTEGWVEEHSFEYDEEWNNILGDYKQADGHATQRYKFHADGKLEDFTKPTYPPFDFELPNNRTWTFDPETRTLTIDGALSYHLIALGEDTFIWDSVRTGTGYPRYFREVFKVKSVE